MKFKNKLIHWLGGITPSEYNNIINDDENPSITKIEPIYADVKSYVIDTDSLIYDKTQLARQLGERLLDNDLIDFSIKQKTDTFGARIYEIRAKAWIGKI